MKCFLDRILERAADKTSRLLPYEEGLTNLETLYAAVSLDEELSVEQRQYIKSQIDKIEKTLQVFSHILYF